MDRKVKVDSNEVCPKEKGVSWQIGEDVPTGEKKDKSQFSRQDKEQNGSN